MHDNARAIVAEVMRRYVPRVLGATPGKLLDVGSLDVNGTHCDLVLSLGFAYVGCDLVAGPNVDVVGGIAAVPTTWRFDAVLSSSQLEHDQDPVGTIHRCRELLRDGGLLFVCAPLLFPIHHEPDYWRFTPAGLEELARVVGLDIVESGLRQCDHERTPAGGLVADSWLVARRGLAR